MKRLILIFTILLALAATASAAATEPEAPYGSQSPSPSADSPRPITRVYSLEIGSRSAYSSYLAPVNYSGFQLGLSGHFSKRMPFAPDKARMSFYGKLEFAPRMLNASRYASMMGLETEFAWTMSAFWKLPNEITIGVGGGPELEAGGLALLKNSNNPAVPNLAAALAADAFLNWNTNIRKLPVTVSLGVRMPLIGAFYMMGYGETYYEIYMGNTSGLVHCGWPGNRQKLDIRAALQMHFGNAGLEVGYHFVFNRATANNLCYKMMTNALTIGLVKW